jgi:hypothetical protein
MAGGKSVRTLIMNKFLKLLFCGFLLSAVACHASNKEKSFELFWPEFRHAVLADDYSSLGKLIKFPLEVKGLDDESPAEFYEADQIKELFPILLSQVIYNYDQDELEEMSFREVITQKVVIKGDAAKTEQRVDQFEFKKIDGQWYLVKAYLE